MEGYSDQDVCGPDGLRSCRLHAVRGKNSISIGLALLLALAWGAASAEVPVDHIPNSLSLPAVYPASWVFVYAYSYPLTLGNFVIVDVAAESGQYKGQVQGAFSPTLIDPVAGQDLYVAESFFKSVGHGKRTDVLTVTRKSTLDSVTEIMLPGSKRGVMTSGNLMDVTRDGKLLLVLNFTPAVSVSVVDPQKRQVVSEVPIPGCTSIYPSGPRGFSSLCANGTLASFALGDKGQVIGEHQSPPFNDIDKDVLYLQPASIGTTTYFVSARGSVRPVDMANVEPVVRPSWPLITPEQAADGWRTADGWYAASDDNGQLYVRLYRETGYDKQQMDNTEVWVYDVTTQKRVRRIPLKNGGISIDVTRGAKPYLVAVAANDPSAGQSLDIYDALTGGFVRTIGGWAPGTFLQLYQAKR